MGEPLIGRIEGARHGHQPTARSMIHLRESLAGFDQDELAPVVERAQLTETPVEQTAQLEWKIGQLSPVTQDAPGDLRWVGDNKTPADHEGRRGGGDESVATLKSDNAGQKQSRESGWLDQSPSFRFTKAYN